MELDNVISYFWFLIRLKRDCLFLLSTKLRTTSAACVQAYFKQAFFCIHGDARFFLKKTWNGLFGIRRRIKMQPVRHFTARALQQPEKPSMLDVVFEVLFKDLFTQFSLLRRADTSSQNALMHNSFA